MRLRQISLFSCLVFLLGTSSTSLAFSPAKPVRHDVVSPNDAFVLDVNPEKQTNTLFATNDRTKPLLTIPGELWLCDVLVSNEGVVVIVHWRYVKDEFISDCTAIAFHNKDGRFRSYSMAELCPHPPRTQDVGPGPIGDFWRTWLETITSNGDEFEIETTGGWTYRFRFSDGTMIDRRKNHWVVYRSWMWVAIIGIPLTFLVAVVLRYKRHSRWPEIRHGLVWGCMWFVSCKMLGMLCCLAVASTILGDEVDHRGGLWRAVQRSPEVREFLSVGLYISFAASLFAGVSAFIWTSRRWKASPPNAMPISSNSVVPEL